MEYLPHTPLDGERLDTLAYHYYGDASRIEPILRANPSLFGLLALSAGAPIHIPMIDPPNPPSQVGLPPWRV